MMSDEKNLNLPVIILAVIPALLFLVFGAIPVDAAWGFNHLKYFPSFVIYIYMLFFILLLIPSASGIILQILANLLSRFHRFPKLLRIAIIIILSGLIFYLLRVHVHSLGDGYQRIYQIEQGYLFYDSEPLDFFLHGLLFRILQFIGYNSAELAYKIFSILLGVSFVAIISQTSFEFEDENGTEIIAKVMILSMGGMQLFFGYVESYGLFITFSLLYIIFSYKFLISGRGIIYASLFFAIAVVSHLTAMIYLPSIIYLIYYNYKKIRHRGMIRKHLPALIVLIPVAGIISMEIWLRLNVSEYLPSVSGGILPLFSADQYSVFSLKHLWDIANEFLLVSPVICVLLPLLIFKKGRYGVSKALLIFMGAVVLCSLAMIMLLDPKLGYARDWDLFATPASAIGLAIILISFKRRLLSSVNHHAQIVIAGLPVLLVFIWLFLNASENRQLRRAENLLDLSNQGRGYSTELLAHYYQSKMNNLPKALELLESIAGSAKNARVMVKIASIQSALGESQKALKSVYEGLALDSNSSILNLMAGDLLSYRGAPDSGLPYLLRAAQLDNKNFGIYYTLGVTYRELDSLPQSVMAFRQAINIQPGSAHAYFRVAEVFQLMNQYDSALTYIRQGLRINPNYPNGVNQLDTVKKLIRNSAR